MLDQLSKSTEMYLKAMICLLVQKGKLIEIGPDGKYCSTCGYESQCNVLATRGKRYMVAPIS